CSMAIGVSFFHFINLLIVSLLKLIRLSFLTDYKVGLTTSFCQVNYITKQSSAKSICGVTTLKISIP
ncbi:hypothetical protein, partial [Legionella pneumophila]|uniref:hypothetical protein n=1 Tax=Legionella pneumophila TaxID=446 RepID=UPI001E3A168F